MERRRIGLEIARRRKLLLIFMVCDFSLALGERDTFVLMGAVGGGYVTPGTPAMFEYFFQVVEGLKKKGKSVSCLFLSYGLFTFSFPPF